MATVRYYLLILFIW